LAFTVDLRCRETGDAGPCKHPGMDSPSATPVTVPVLDAGDIRLRPFRRDDASWVYYVSLDAELRRRLSLPDP
jgi:hypothetical protein